MIKKAAEHPRGNFAATRWSLVIQAGAQDPPSRRKALSELCQIYWSPAFSFICRRVGDSELARDITQDFFTKVVENDYFAAADASRGRFRTFLLTMLSRHIGKNYAMARAAKRGGAAITVSRDGIESGNRERLEPIETVTAETIFERTWALTLLSNALKQLRDEHSHGGKDGHFDLLFGYLDGTLDGLAYREVAERLGISEGAVKTAVCRLRKRYGEILRELVADLVIDPTEIDDEIRHLLSVV